MHPIVNMIIGAVMLIAAIAYVNTDQYGAWSDFLTVVNGVVPAFVALIGVFIIWLELDELKVQRELKSEKPRKK